jgi:hypothetical protein
LGLAMGVIVSMYLQSQIIYLIGVFFFGFLKRKQHSFQGGAD